MPLPPAYRSSGRRCRGVCSGGAFPASDVSFRRVGFFPVRNRNGTVSGIREEGFAGGRSGEGFPEGVVRNA